MKERYMKKLPYKNMFVVLQINDSIRNIFFDELIDYENYSDVDFDEHLTFMAQVAVVNDDSARELFLLLCQSYLNTKTVIKEFKSMMKDDCLSSSEMCVTLIFDLQINDDDTGTVQIDTWAHEDKRDTFNDIANYASDVAMSKLIEGLSIEHQNLLFEIA